MAATVFLVAGEPSGDALGGALMTAIRAEAGADVRFAGVGGPDMIAAGLESLYPMEELSVMGLIEVLPSLRRILRRLDETAEAIRTVAPDVVVTIDSQGFSARLARRLAPSPCPVVHYVAPTVWAWKPWRAKRLAEIVDRVLLLFPFEKPYWDAVSLDAVEVGHPVAATSLDDTRRAERRTELLDGADGPLLAVLPGSRRGEIRRHLSIFGETVRRLAARMPGLTLVLPTVPYIADEVRAATAGWNVPATVVAGSGEERLLAMGAADVALAASGTVALELSAVGTPHVIAYRANPVTAAVVRRMVTISYASPVNLVADREVTPELLQENCTPERLAAALEPLLAGGAAAQRQREGMDAVMTALGRGGEAPARRAARAVLEMLDRPPQRP